MPPYFSKEEELEARIKSLESWKREHEKNEDVLESKQAKAALSAILTKDTPEDCILVAHSTGDGWQLGVETVDGEVVALLAWPRVYPSVMSADNLRDKGFEVI